MAPVGHRGMGPPGKAAERAAGAQFGSAAPREVEPGAGTSPLPLAELKGLLSVGAVPAARLHAPGPPGATHPLQGFPGPNAAPVAPRISSPCAPPERRPVAAPLGSAVPRGLMDGKCAVQCSCSCYCSSCSHIVNEPQFSTAGPSSSRKSGFSRCCFLEDPPRDNATGVGHT